MCARRSSAHVSRICTGSKTLYMSALCVCAHGLSPYMSALYVVRPREPDLHGLKDPIYVCLMCLRARAEPLYVCLIRRPPT